MGVGPDQRTRFSPEKVKSFDEVLPLLNAFPPPAPPSTGPGTEEERKCLWINNKMKSAEKGLLNMTTLNNGKVAPYGKVKTL